MAETGVALTILDEYIAAWRVDHERPAAEMPCEVAAVLGAVRREMLARSRTVSSMREVLAEVAAERQRQDERWGEQNHPLVATYPSRTSDRRTIHLHLDVPVASVARAQCDARHARGEGSWVDILVEELAETVDAGGALACAELDGGSDECLSKACEAELIQLAAVAVAAVEALRRRRGAAMRGVGSPGVRDPDHPCTEYDPGPPVGGAECGGDGHHLCGGCRELSAEARAAKGAV